MKIDDMSFRNGMISALESPGIPFPFLGAEVSGFRGSLPNETGKKHDIISAKTNFIMTIRHKATNIPFFEKGEL